MPLNVYDRVSAFMPFVVLACIYLAFSFRSFRRTIHLVRHGVVTEGHLIVDGKVRFVTLQGITLEFHSQAKPDRVGTVVPILYDPLRPSIAYIASATTIGFSPAFNVCFSILLVLSCLAGLFAFLRWELILLIIPALLIVSVVVGMIYVSVLSLTIGAKVAEMPKGDVQTQNNPIEDDREELSQL